MGTRIAIGMMLAVLVPVGCKKTDKTEPATAAGSGSAVVAPGSGSAAVTPPPSTGAAPCPEDAALAQKLRAHLKLDAAVTLQIECAAGNFGKPGWFVAALADADGTPVQHTGVLATDGQTALVAFSGEEMSFGHVESSAATHEAHDLDGDGVDEVVTLWHSDRRGFDTTGIGVARVTNGKLTHVQGPQVAYDDSAAQEDANKASGCTGSHAIAPAGTGKHIVVTVTETSGKPDAENCLPVGKHAFALQGDKVVEVK